MAWIDPSEDTNKASGGMEGPFPAAEIPRPQISSERGVGEHNPTWLLSRSWGGYPELEWTFSVFGERLLALSGIITAYFYEPLSEFNTARYLLRYGAHLRARRASGTPAVGMGFEYYDRAYRSLTGRLLLPAPGESFRGPKLAA
jgi:hypothetical protein